MENSEALFFFWQGVDKVIKISEDEKKAYWYSCVKAVFFKFFFLTQSGQLFFQTSTLKIKEIFFRKFLAVGNLPFEI